MKKAMTIAVLMVCFVFAATKCFDLLNQPSDVDVMLGMGLLLLEVGVIWEVIKYLGKKEETDAENGKANEADKTNEAGAKPGN